VDGSAFAAAYRAPRATKATTASGAVVEYFAFPFATPAVPPAYVFDHRCAAPAGYAYDARRDGFRLDEQGTIFTALPSDAYAPLVGEVAVVSNGEACQSKKSLASLRASDVIVPSPDGTLLALAIVDPNYATGRERLGWYEHYLVTYLDGGELPRAADGTLRAQRLCGDTVAAARGEVGYSPLCRRCEDDAYVFCLQVAP
jgi:hypothetical protein